MLGGRMAGYLGVVRRRCPLYLWQHKLISKATIPKIPPGGGSLHGQMVLVPAFHLTVPDLTPPS